MAVLAPPVTTTILSGPASPASGGKPVTFIAQCRFSAQANIDAAGSTAGWIAGTPATLPTGTVIKALLGWGFTDASGSIIETGALTAATPVLTNAGANLTWQIANGTVGTVGADIICGVGQTFYLNLLCQIP